MSSVQGPQKYRNEQDLEFVVSVPMINDKPFDLTGSNWDLHINGSSSSVILKCVSEKIESIGNTSANAEVKDGNLIVYVKSSKVPLGPGRVSVDMTIYAPNDKFEEEIQVMKTLKYDLPIMLI